MMYGMMRLVGGRSRTSTPSGRRHQSMAQERTRGRDTVTGVSEPVAFADLLAHPDVVEHLELRSSVGLLALHGGLEPGTAEIAQAVAASTGASCYTISQPTDLRM